eukprot:CAMPEP_0201550288 /NCGR_PEP_ID=MMETSP0173_2-20130828/6673_1 /ASSEMBLY_ACC=CAM_ASM_000268 /TAXON_ID=218659 /ORGANISM="Vexillifera sp., Strain DIVA3 564/2" /LENGTH=355 /DNA_ID=CAMNT_0047960219 /DNA_START=145 /DNA_END=1209 /DNA_ORIENTATION=+
MNVLGWLWNNTAHNVGKIVRGTGNIIAPVGYAALAAIFRTLAKPLRNTRLEPAVEWVHQQFVKFSILIGLSAFLRELDGKVPGIPENYQPTVDDGATPNVDVARLTSFLAAVAYFDEVRARRCVLQFVDQATVKMVGQYNDTEILIVHLPNNNVVFSFRGTEFIGGDWWNNFNFQLQYISQQSLRTLERAARKLGANHTTEFHHGFALKLFEKPSGGYYVVKQILEKLNARNEYTIHFTGHSLGGALGTLCASALLRQMNNQRLQLKNIRIGSVYTFSKPPEVDIHLSKNIFQLFQQNNVAQWHFGHPDDIVHNSDDDGKWQNQLIKRIYIPPNWTHIGNDRRRRVPHEAAVSLW